MLVSTIVTPIARVHWSTIYFWPHYELYLTWGTYDLLTHRIEIYSSEATNHYLTLGLPYLVALCVVFGVVLSVIILYSSRTSYRPVVGWVVVASVFLLQIVLPLNVFRSLSGPISWERLAVTTYVLPLPIPSFLTIVALLVLHLMRRPNPIREATSPLSA